MRLLSLAKTNAVWIYCDFDCAEGRSQICMCIVHLSSSGFSSPVSNPSLSRTNVGWIHCDFGVLRVGSNTYVHRTLIKY